MIIEIEIKDELYEETLKAFIEKYPAHKDIKSVLKEFCKQTLKEYKQKIAGKEVEDAW